MKILFVLFFSLLFLISCEKAVPTEIVPDTGMTVVQNGLVFRHESGPRTYLSQNKEGDGILSVYNGAGNINALYAPNGLALYENLKPKTSLDNKGNLSLAFGGGVFINYQRVLNKRQSAISDVVNPEDVVIRFNQLLAALREHGLIER